MSALVQVSKVSNFRSGEYVGLPFFFPLRGPAWKDKQRITAQGLWQYRKSPCHLHKQPLPVPGSCFKWRWRKTATGAAKRWDNSSRQWWTLNGEQRKGWDVNHKEQSDSRGFRQTLNCNCSEKCATYSGTSKRRLLTNIPKMLRQSQCVCRCKYKPTRNYSCTLLYMQVQINLNQFCIPVSPFLTWLESPPLTTWRAQRTVLYGSTITVS